MEDSKTSGAAIAASATIHGVWISCMNCQWSSADVAAKHDCPRDPDRLEARLRAATEDRSTLLWAIRHALRVIRQTRDEHVLSRDGLDTLAWLDGHDGLQIALSRSDTEDAAEPQ